MDPKLLETRLLLRESAIGFVSVSRCALKLKNLISSNDSANLDAYLRDILLYDLEINKISQNLQVCEEEIIEYNEIEKNLEETINETQKSINNYEMQLKQENIVRKHRELCELLASDVNTLTTRSQLTKEINNFNDNLITIKDSLQLIDTQILVRNNQYNNLIVAITLLQTELYDEDEDEELRKNEKSMHEKMHENSINNENDNNIIDDDEDNEVHESRRNRNNENNHKNDKLLNENDENNENNENQENNDMNEDEIDNENIKELSETNENDTME